MKKLTRLQFAGLKLMRNEIAYFAVMWRRLLPQAAPL
jgi:hypothetical protein